ncbi:UNVERIFIED_CONTAM: hypothetical protein GTU68_027030, partial [Idotea baltica]|nr:hypothetical protein [Idotea baltica]
HGEQILPSEDHEVQITSSENKSTLVISEIFEDDSGDYTVTATNPAGKASSTATLLVEGEVAEEFSPPEFCPPLTPLRVMDGERVRFTCKVKAHPTPKISWFHNGRPIDHHREVKVMQTPDGKVGLLISEVFPEDSGDYTCVARNKAGEARCTTSLAVEAYEYQPDSEAATIASLSDKQIFSGTASEDEILDIEKDSESDSEAGAAPFFSHRLENAVEVIEGSPVRLVAQS